MRRRSRRQVVAALATAGSAALAGCTGLLGGGTETGEESTDESPDETVSVDGAWRTFQGDDRNTGGAATPTGPGDSPSVAWEVTADDEARGDPVVADGTVLASSWDGTLYALGPDGTERWTYESDSGTLGRPAAVASGVAFVGDDGGTVAAVDVESGDPAWTTELEAGGLRGGPVLADGSLYVPAGDHLVALDAETGEQRWSFRAADPVAATPAVADGRVFVPSLDGYLYAVGADGDERWKATVSTQGGLPEPTVADGTVFVGWGDGTLYAFDAASGDRQWSERIGGAATVAVADGTLFQAGYDVAAMDPASGETLWERDGLDGIERAVTVGEDAVYVAGGSTVLSLSPADGSVRWRHATEYEVVTSPALVDGTLVYGDAYGTIVGLA